MLGFYFLINNTISCGNKIIIPQNIVYFFLDIFKKEYYILCLNLTSVSVI